MLIAHAYEAERARKIANVSPGEVSRHADIGADALSHEQQVVVNLVPMLATCMYDHESTLSGMLALVNRLWF